MVLKENVNKNLIPKPIKNQMITQEHNDDEEQNQRAKGRNLDEKSTVQNFMHVARQDDISPRQMEKGKSAGKGKRKQANDTPSLQAPGVQTRRTVYKSSNQ